MRCCSADGCAEVSVFRFAFGGFGDVFAHFMLGRIMQPHYHRRWNAQEYVSGLSHIYSFSLKTIQSSTIREMDKHIYIYSMLWRLRRKAMIIACQIYALNRSTYRLIGVYFVLMWTVKNMV